MRIKYYRLTQLKNLKKIVITIIISLLTIQLAFNQDALKKNSVYLELVGIGGYGSINYERNFYITENNGINAGLGISYFQNNDIQYPGIPFRLNYFYKMNRHNFSTGFAFRFFQTEVTFFPSYDSSLYGSDIPTLVEIVAGIFAFTLEYRYSISKDKFFIGMGLTPFIGRSYANGIKLWGEVQIGYKF